MKSLSIAPGSGRWISRIATPTALMLLFVLSCGRTAPAGTVDAAGTLHTLTNADNGTTLTIPVGDSVELRLPADLNWDVTISNAAVLHRPPVALARGVQGLWNAAAPGQSQILATGTAICAPGTACPQFAAVFSATVVVTSGTSPGAASASYPPGWNIVGGPSGTTFPVTLYRWDPAPGQYATLSPGTPVQAGQGYWAHFDQPTMVSLAAAVAAPLPTVPGGEWVMVANPYSGDCAGINVGPPSPGGSHDPNVVAADTYDPQQGGYNQANGALLTPGQGVWLLLESSATLPIVDAGAPAANGGCIAPP